MNSWTAIEEALRRRGKTGSVACTATVRRIKKREHLYYRFGAAPGKPTLRDSFDAQWPNDVEDSEAFEAIEKRTHRMYCHIEARQGKHGTEFRVDGGVWCYRLRDAMFRLKEDA